MTSVPPPRYSAQQTVQAAANGVSVAVMETTNVLSRPEGPEYQLLAGEGAYVLHDDLHLATPPPHPSEAPPANPNPLQTVMGPPSAGTRMSIANMAPPKKSPIYNVNEASSTWSVARQTHSIKESARESQSPGESASGRLSSDAERPPFSNGLHTFGNGNTLLAPPVSNKDTKRRKPKSNMVKSNSSFISRVIPNENLAKKLQERDVDGSFAFVNINRAFQWLDLSSPNMSEHLCKILFTRANALCHDVNTFTLSSSHIDVILGFSTGDIIWYEPIAQKYSRLNKNGVINANPILEIKWIPGSENFFLAAHTDGTLVVYDKEREDATFVPEETEEPDPHQQSPNNEALHVKKSLNSKNQKSNPVSWWKLSNQRINAFSFSPDGKHLAVVSEDGSLRIIDYLEEKLLDIYTSYYGGFSCVCWSPDGKYVVTGGQDDLVSIWSLGECRLVARCQGHQSWVTAVAFDRWRCDGRNYRFGSVGEDRRLLLWDFSVGMLHRPKASSVRHRGSISSQHHQHFMPGGKRTRTESSATNRFRSNSNVTAGAATMNEEKLLIRHAVEPRAHTAMLPPVLSRIVDSDPLAWLAFEEDCIITSCSMGHIRTWYRPTVEGRNGSQITVSKSGVKEDSSSGI